MASGKKYGYPFIKKTFTNKKSFTNVGTANNFDYIIPTGYKVFSVIGFDANSISEIKTNASGTETFVYCQGSPSANEATVTVVFIREDLNITGITGSTGTT